MNLGTGMRAMLRKMEMRFAVEIAVNIEEKREKCRYFSRNLFSSLSLCEVAYRVLDHSLVSAFAGMSSRFCAIRFAINGGITCGPNASRPTTKDRAAFFTVVAISIDTAFL